MISVRNISFSYGKNDVLKDINFDVPRGECVGILGNNGVGKSTLITCLNKIRTPKSGKVYIDNRDVMKMGRLETARHISYVAQKNELSQMTVFDAVLLGRRPYIKWAVSQEDMDICGAMIDRMDLSEFKLRYINELSGGELQKVVLARALVQHPRLLLLDEPTSSLDPRSQHEVLALIRKLAKERNISVLIVIHDLNLALRYCDKFLFVRSGVVFSYGGREVMTPENIAAVYGMNASVETVKGVPVVVPQPLEA
jgi:iron complex transport system ATP-binding protein